MDEYLSPNHPNPWPPLTSGPAESAATPVQSEAPPDTPASAQSTTAAYKRPALSEADQLAIRAEIGALGKDSEGLKNNVHHHRARLERIARQIPDFASYRKIVIDDLRYAWNYDRMHNTRTVRNQVERWKRLFLCWAAQMGEQQCVKIRSLGHSGAYECELAERPLADIWERFIDIGVEAGASLAALNDVYLQFKDAPVKTIRAGGKFSQHGTGPVALPFALIEGFTKESGTPK